MHKNIHKIYNIKNNIYYLGFIISIGFKIVLMILVCLLIVRIII
jgi:hypothetical protein